MVYKWKLSGLYDVEAQAAGEELQRIYNERGRLDPQDIVDEFRPQDAVLHPCFEWSDPVAAERWREHQAQQIVRCVITVAETETKEPVEVRVKYARISALVPVFLAIDELRAGA